MENNWDKLPTILQWQSVSVFHAQRGVWTVDLVVLAGGEADARTVALVAESAGGLDGTTVTLDSLTERHH